MVIRKILKLTCKVCEYESNATAFYVVSLENSFFSNIIFASDCGLSLCLKGKIFTLRKFVLPFALSINCVLSYSFRHVLT